MPKHFKANPVFSKNKNLNVDRENGIIKNVVIVQQGANKNGTYFSEKYINDLVAGANEIKQGVKSRFGHPNMCSTSLGSFIGRYKNFRAEKGKAKADLHLDPIAKKTQVEGKGISMFEYVMDMAENNSDMFGNSIHIPTPEYEEDQVKLEGVKYFSHVFNGIVASDVVDDPAATDQLFSNSDDLGIVITNFLDENPTIFNVILKDPAIIEDFFSRYFNYLQTYNKQKIDMSFLDKLKKKFGAKATFDIEETTATGDIVKVVTENETPQVGDSVTDAEGKAIADGEHTLKDGSVWVTEGGKITEIREGSDDGDDDGEGDEEPTMEAVMQSVSALTASFNSFKTQYSKDLKESQDAIEMVHDDLDKKFKTLAKNVKSKSPDYQGEQGNKKKFATESGYDPDKVREAREARKNPNKDK